MSRDKLIFYISTGILSVMMLISAGTYLFNHDEIVLLFQSLNYPEHIIYPLAIAKLLGLLFIWTRKLEVLVYFSYAGFMYDFVLAFIAHTTVRDGQQGASVIAFIMLATSFVFYRRLYAGNASSD